MSRDVNLWGTLQKAASIGTEILEAKGELTPELEQKIDTLAIEVAERGDEAHLVLENLESSVDGFKKIEAFYYTARKASENAHKRLKDKIKQFMSDTETREIAGNNVTFKIKNGKASLEIDEAKLPRSYFRVVTPPQPAPFFEVDTDKVKQDLELGVVIPGANLKENFALTIKPKN